MPSRQHVSFSNLTFIVQKLGVIVKKLDTLVLLVFSELQIIIKATELIS